ncbi:hypothetical protein NST74_07210 [Paenibacillus sp. FSL F4-0125]
MILGFWVNKHSEHLDTAEAFVKWMLEASGFNKFAGFIPVIKNKVPMQ